MLPVISSTSIPNATQSITVVIVTNQSSSQSNCSRHQINLTCVSISVKSIFSHLSSQLDICQVKAITQLIICQSSVSPSVLYDILQPEFSTIDDLKTFLRFPSSCLPWHHFRPSSVSWDWSYICDNMIRLNVPMAAKISAKKSPKQGKILFWKSVQCIVKREAKNKWTVQ